MPKEPKPERPSSEQLKAVLSDRNRFHRHDAFYAYSCYEPDIVDLPTLRAALKDAEFVVVRFAVVSIGKLGPQAKEAIGELYDAARRQDPALMIPQVYSQALDALISLGASEVMLLDLIQSHFGITNWAFLRDSLLALRRIGTPKATALLSRIIAFAIPDLNKKQLDYIQKHFADFIPQHASAIA
jgi:HEAT repeat protein